MQSDRARRSPDWDCYWWLWLTFRQPERNSSSEWIYQLLKLDNSQQSPSNCSRPNDRVCAFFAVLVNFFRTGGKELENFGCNTIKFTLFPPPLPSPKTLWIFLWFPRSVFYSPPIGLCWRRLISPPFPPENHVILPKILHLPLLIAKS